MSRTLLELIEFLKEVWEQMAGESGGDENLGNQRLELQERHLIQFLEINAYRAKGEIKTLEERVRDLQSKPKEDRIEDDYVSEMHELIEDISALKTYFQIE